MCSKGIQPAANTYGMRTRPSQWAARISKADELLKGICLPGFYGKSTDGGVNGTLGQECAECPTGATCEGYEHMPKAKRTWYRSWEPQDSSKALGNLNDPNKLGCHPKQRYPNVPPNYECPYVFPCEPPGACLSNNQCAQGYSDINPTTRRVDNISEGCKVSRAKLHTMMQKCFAPRQSLF